MSSIQVRYISFMMLFTLMLSACALPLQDSAEKTIYIGPAMVECEGEGPQMCLQVKENPQDEYSNFYGQIEGFDYQEGYEYVITVKEESIEDPPAGGSSIRWVLVEEVSRTAVESAQSAPELEQTPWVLASYRSESGDLEGVLPGTEVMAGFNNGQITGNAGCNNYFASYQLEETALRVSEIGMTEMYCADPENIMAQEIAYLNALANSASYSLEAGQLFIMDSEGDLLLVFNQYEPFELVGTDWTLNFYNDGRGGFISVIEDTQINAVFSEEGTLSGSAGCNDYRAGYLVEGQSISIEQVVLTRKACPEAVMEQENAFVSALESAETYRIELDMLTVDNADGMRVLSFAGVKTGDESPPEGEGITEASETAVPTPEKEAPTATSEVTSTVPATPTPGVTDTPQPTSTPQPTDLPNLVFEDDFAFNTGWTEYQSDMYSFSWKDGAYYIDANLPNGFVYSTRNLEYSDVILEADAQFIDGSDQNYYGLLCRFTKGVNYYVFVINDSGSYAVGKVEGGLLEYLKQGTDQSGIIKQDGQYNRLRADCVGETLSLFVNGEKLIEIQDDTFQDGTVGLIAITSYKNQQLLVRFDYFGTFQPE